MWLVVCLMYWGGLVMMRVVLVRLVKVVLLFGVLWWEMYLIVLYE